MKNKIFLLLLLIPLFAQADHAWNGYHWETESNNIAELSVIESVTDFWNLELYESLLKWNDSDVLNITIDSIENDEIIRSTCPMVSGKIRVCNYNYGSTNWLGLTSIGLNSTAHLDRAVVRINDSYSSYWNNQSTKNHVMCHENGHTYGLDHTSEDGSSQSTCMDISFNVASQWPNIHDYEQLLTIYNHSHDQVPDPDPEPDPDDPPKCKGNDKDCDGVPDNGGKGNGKGKNKFDIDDVKIPPQGLRVHANKNSELWVSPRGDGGIWIHHAWLVDPKDRVNNEIRGTRNLFGVEYKD